MRLAMDHTWEYVGGNLKTEPDATHADHDAWVTQDRAARRRLFLALSDEVKESILHLADSPASAIFDACQGMSQLRFHSD